MIGALAWLTGSQTGRTVAAIGIAALTIAAVLWRAFAAGQNAERAAQMQASLEALRNRIKTDDEIQKMDAGTRRRELSRWLSDNRP